MEKNFLRKGIDQNKDGLSRALFILVKKKERACVENFVKFLLIYLLGSLLFTNTSCSEPPWLVAYVDDLSSLDKYAWAQEAHKWIMDTLPGVAARVKDRCLGKEGQGRNPTLEEHQEFYATVNIVIKSKPLLLLL